MAATLARECGLRVLAFDPLAAVGEKGPGLVRQAEEMGVVLHGEIGPWLGAAEAVFSLVPGTVAVAAAQGAVAHMAAGSGYVDLNSITGDMMKDVAAVFADSPVQVVDGSVLGNFQGGNRVPVLLTGEGANRIAALLPDSHFLVDVIDGQIGDASAIKMLRSVLMKGLEALCVECLVAAEAQGVRHLLLEAFKDLDSRPFVRTMEILTVTHPIHAARRLKEVERVASVLEKYGVEGTLTEATRVVFARSAEANLSPDSKDPKDLQKTIELLRGPHSTVGD